MEKDFNIPQENASSAFMYVLMELQAQQTAAMQMLAEILANVKDEPVKSVIARYQEVFQAQKLKCVSELHVRFGDIDLKDVLGG